MSFPGREIKMPRAGGLESSAYNPQRTKKSQEDNSMSGLFNSAASAASSSATATQGDISGDVQLQSPPEDSISDLSFSPASDHLAVASWDKKVRIYEIDGSGNSQGKAAFDHEGPVLSCAWSKVSEMENKGAIIPYPVILTLLQPGWIKSLRSGC